MTKSIKLIFSNSNPTSKIFGEMVDAWWYSHKGFEVEFWDLSPLFYSKENLDKYYGGAIDFRYLGPNHRVFHTKSEAVEALSQNIDALHWYLSRFLRSHNDDWWIKEMNRFKINYLFHYFVPFYFDESVKERLKIPLRFLKAKWKNRICKPCGIGSVSGEIT